MNIWTKKSIELATTANYLDQLQKVYPMAVNLRREINSATVAAITSAYENRDDQGLLSLLLKQEIFPIKDSFVAYLKKDKSAILRNPETVERITNLLYSLSLEEILDRIAVPKETNRQIGPLFKRWVRSGSLVPRTTSSTTEFLESEDTIIFDGTDDQMMQLARDELGYTHTKGLDFIAKSNGKYVIAEAKFLSDFGGHQNAQFSDAITTMRAPIITNKTVIPFAILDGVLFIVRDNKMHQAITTGFDDEEVIISSLLLNEFLESL